MKSIDYQNCETWRSFVSSKTVTAYATIVEEKKELVEFPKRRQNFSEYENWMEEHLS